MRVVGIALLLAAGSIGLVVSGSHPRHVSVRLAPRAESGVRGAAVVSAAAGGTTAVLRVAGPGLGAHPLAALRGGSCARPGVRYALLPKLKAAPHRRFTARGAIRSRAGKRVPFVRATSGAYVLTVEVRARVLACGKLRRKRARTQPPPQPGTGGSTATCNPSPCTDPGWSSFTVTVPDSDGSGARQVQRLVAVDRPTHLVGRAPLVVVIGGNWGALAASKKFTLLLLPDDYHCPTSPGVPCNGTGYYAYPAIQADLSYGQSNCGVSGTGRCDDIPWLLAALRATVCARGGHCLDVDPNKVYFAGSSKGGGLAMAAVCDTRTSHYFHAAMVISYTLFAPVTDYPVTGHPDQSVPGNCPAVLGTSTGIGGPAGLPAHTNLSIGWEYGTHDTSGVCPAPLFDCLEQGAEDIKGRWHPSNQQLAGDRHPDAGGPIPASAAGSAVGFGARLGCNGTPTTDTTSGNTGKVRTRVYTGCTKSRRAVETIKVDCGATSCHGLSAAGSLDQIDGFNGELAAWDFFVKYGG